LVFVNGNQFGVLERNPFSAWAVRPAEVVAVPAPQTVALLLAGQEVAGTDCDERRN
jgi:hypothetical protein